MKNKLLSMIHEANNESQPAICNRKVTEAHYVLFEQFQDVVGRDAGANFHTWAVWGSKKAGVTIRQEDLDSALWNAIWVAGIVGFISGAGITYALFQKVNIPSKMMLSLAVLGGVIGALTGAATGRSIAKKSRKDASKLILEGNRLVLGDIGQQSAQFISCFNERAADGDKLHAFYSEMKAGKTEEGGQELLKRAFENYAAASTEQDVKIKRQLCYKANCLAILHEHIKLQPYIAKSMPRVIRRCVTKRMMEYDVGDLTLSVAEELPLDDIDQIKIGLEQHSIQKLIDFIFLPDDSKKSDAVLRSVSSEGKYSAQNWSDINQRMHYIFKLFLRFHMSEAVKGKPCKN